MGLDLAIFAVMRDPQLCCMHGSNNATNSSQAPNASSEIPCQKAQCLAYPRHCKIQSDLMGGKPQTQTPWAMVSVHARVACTQHPRMHFTGDASPGPAAYASDQCLDSQRVRKPAYTMASRPAEGAKGPGTPGPGNYPGHGAEPTTPRAPAYSFGTSTPRSKSSYTPGPAGSHQNLLHAVFTLWCCH